MYASSDTHPDMQILNNRIDPFSHLCPVLVFRILLCIPHQAFLGERLRLGLLFTIFEPFHLSFHRLPRIDQIILVLDVRIADPARSAI